MRLIDEKVQFDILVTTHLMPGMTGTDLAYAVQRLHPDRPFCSCRAMPNPQESMRRFPSRLSLAGGTV
jgi:hypothetical protein